MSIICPAITPITSVVAQNCPEIWDQVQVIAFQERGDTSFSAVGDLQALAIWTTLLAAVDSTKVQAGLVYNPIFNASEELTVGGNDNTTQDGIPDSNGEGFTALTWEFRNLLAENKRAMLDWRPHSIASVTDTNLVAFFFARGNKLIYNTVDGSEFTGFPVYNLRISSVSTQGLNSQNIYLSGVSVGENWDNYFATTQVAFNPKVDLLP